MDAKEGFVTINSVSTHLIQFGLSDLITKLTPDNECEQYFNDVAQCDTIVFLVSGKK